MSLPGEFQGARHTALEGMQMSTAIMENSMEVSPKKVKIGLPCDPAIPVLAIYPKEMKSSYQRDACTALSTAAPFTITSSAPSQVSIHR